MTTGHKMKLFITSKELEVLRLSTEHDTVEAVAEELQVSKKEINMTLKSVYKKLNTKSSAESLMKLARSEFIVSDT